MHTSIKLDNPIEFVNITPVNPLISQCQIKVCYVGDEPNRNRSIITKDTARNLANSIPGSPIVGFFNEASGDFEEHNRIIDISNGKFQVKDTTRPYGFVSMDAKVWFQWFEDDGVPHEYLMTEGYLWTGQYPECKRVIDNGNNQSMELDEKFIDAQWTKDNNGKPEFFIINEAIMSKLCILGEDVEPCFEGAQITPKIEFSFDDGFKTQLFSLINEMTKILNKGGTPMFNRYAVTVGDTLWNALYENVDMATYSIVEVLEKEDQKMVVLQNRADNSYSSMNFSFENEEFAAEEIVAYADYAVPEEAQFSAEDVSAFEAEYACGGSGAKKKKEEEYACGGGKKDKKEDFKKEDEKAEPPMKEDSSAAEDDKKEAEDKKSEDEKPADEEDKKKKKYNLDEIEEYTALSAEYSELQNKFSALENELEKANASIDTLKDTIETLTQFKLGVERTEKQAMIDKFYMVPAEDKEDVIKNIDTYSLDDIEAKLAVVCVRKGLNFTQEEEHTDIVTTYNLDDNSLDDEVPAWIKAVLDTEKTLK